MARLVNWSRQRWRAAAAVRPLPGRMGSSSARRRVGAEASSRKRSRLRSTMATRSIGVGGKGGVEGKRGACKPLGKQLLGNLPILRWSVERCLRYGRLVGGTGKDLSVFWRGSPVQVASGPPCTPMAPTPRACSWTVLGGEVRAHRRRG